MMDINVALLTEENHSECSDLMKLSALQTLAAAYRELTTPVSEAPEGSVVVYGFEEGYLPKNAMICIHHKERGKFSFLPIPEVKA